MNEKKIKRSKTNFIWYGVGVLLITMVIGIGLGIEKYDTEVYWTNFWAVEAAMITAVLAIVGVFFELSKKEEERQLEEEKIHREREKDEKQKEIEKEDKIKEYRKNLVIKETKEKQNNLISHIQEINQEACITLIKWEDYLSSMGEKELDEKNMDRDLEQEMVKLLYKYQRFYELYDQVGELKRKVESDYPGTDLEDNENNLDPKSQIPEIFNVVLSYKNFLSYRTKIEEHFPTLIGVLDRITPNTNYDKSEGSGDKGIIDKNILGEWITNSDRARQVKYLVGTSMVSKKIISIYKVNKDSINETEDGRVEFANSQLIYKYSKADDNGASDILKNWTSRNPVLYYNAWISDEDRADDKLKELIRNNDNTAGNLEERNDILIVKTNNYAEKVTSANIRKELPKIFSKVSNESNKNELERNELVKELENRFPYVIDHPGVYQGVFNKLNDSEKTYVLKENDENMRLTNGRSEDGRSIYYFINISN